MAIESIMTAMPRAMPARAMLTMGFENEFSPLSLPLSILRAMNDSIFNGIFFDLRTRKSRKLIVRHLLCSGGLTLIAMLMISCGWKADYRSEEPDRVEAVEQPEKLRIGAEQIDSIVRICEGKRVAIVANQTSQVAGVHLLDTLLSQGVSVVRVFGPEHGFRGDAADGEKVDHSKDSTTGLPIVSLYGNNKKPTAEQMRGIDLIIFDIQDVGARFYTYISTLHMVMEAAAENEVKVLVLDRPNPHGHYVDGPVLKPAFKSFVGMHPVPVVHGLTVAEYAQMINGEAWLAGGVQCELEILPCRGYNRNDIYELPVSPSPNLPNTTSIYLYPSLAFFEGTNVSVGRGTDLPFQQIGMPGYTEGEYRFTPRSIPGVSKYPPHEGKECVGYNLSDLNERPDQLDLSYLLRMYKNAPDQQAFFLKSGFFNKLAGNDLLMKQIIGGKTEEEIRASWQDDLSEFRATREKYLIYPE